MNARFCCFVTGTDTEIGKTLVSCALLHALNQRGMRAAGMKPVAAGATLRDNIWHNEDADALTAASSLKLPPTLATPYLLRAAMAPHLAAEAESIVIDPQHIVRCYREIRTQADVIVVEGVGGFRVPLAPGYDTADLAVQFGLPVILVVGLRLGCLNHALLTAEAIATRGLTLAGWVANTVDAAMPHLGDNVAALADRLAAPLLGVVPRMAHASPAQAAEHLDFSRLPGWPASAN